MLYVLTDDVLRPVGLFLVVDGVECSRQVQEHNRRSLTSSHSKMDIVLNGKKSGLSGVSGRGATESSTLAERAQNHD